MPVPAYALQQEQRKEGPKNTRGIFVCFLAQVKCEMEKVCRLVVNGLSLQIGKTSEDKQLEN